MPYKDWDALRRDVNAERQRLKIQQQRLDRQRAKLNRRIAKSGLHDVIEEQIYAERVNADIAKRPWAFDPYYLPFKEHLEEYRLVKRKTSLHKEAPHGNAAL
jgi:hypothetical protein